MLMWHSGNEDDSVDGDSGNDAAKEERAKRSKRKKSHTDSNINFISLSKANAMSGVVICEPRNNVPTTCSMLCAKAKQYTLYMYSAFGSQAPSLGRAGQRKNRCERMYDAVDETEFITFALVEEKKANTKKWFNDPCWFRWNCVSKIIFVPFIRRTFREMKNMFNSTRVLTTMFNSKFISHLSILSVYQLFGCWIT